MSTQRAARRFNSRPLRLTHHRQAQMPMPVDRLNAFLAVVAPLATLGALACSGASAPMARPLSIPAFVYVADANGLAQLVRWRNDSAVALTSGSTNADPNSAASRLVFTSTRDGLPQVYIADLDATTVHRVTNSPSFDRSASLSPSADSIVFVSTRSGTPRLWVINAPALNAVVVDNPSSLATGSDDWVPEDGPAWNPRGSTIAFTSTRGGISQVYVVASGGGTPLAITNEVAGAFQPTWSQDGTTIYYVAAMPALVLRKVSARGGRPSTVVDDPLGVGGPMSCSAALCLFGTNPQHSGGSISALSLSGGDAQVIFSRTAAQERQPALLVR